MDVSGEFLAADTHGVIQGGIEDNLTLIPCIIWISLTGTSC